MAITGGQLVDLHLGAGAFGVLQAKGQGRAIQEFRWHRHYFNYEDFKINLGPLGWLTILQQIAKANGTE